MNKEEFFKKYQEIILKTNGGNDDYVVALCQISNLINEFVEEQEQQIAQLKAENERLMAENVLARETKINTNKMEILHLEIEISELEIEISELQQQLKDNTKQICEKIRNWCKDNTYFCGSGICEEYYKDCISYNRALKDIKEFLDQIEKGGAK